MRLFCLMPEGERVVVGVGLVGREDGAITLCGSDVADSQFRQSGGMSDGWGDPGSRAACAAEARPRTTGAAAAAGIDRHVSREYPSENTNEAGALCTTGTAAVVILAIVRVLHLVGVAHDVAQATR